MISIDKRIVVLEITTWVGTDPEAEHYYGTLRALKPFSSLILTRPLTKRQASKLNAKLNEALFEKGDKSPCFESISELKEYAKSVYKEEFGEGSILIKGTACSGEPQEILDAPFEIMKRGNEMWDESENKIGWNKKFGMYYRPAGTQTRVDELCDEWGRLLKDYK